MIKFVLNTEVSYDQICLEHISELLIIKFASNTKVSNYEICLECNIELW
jgi:hypothetical protein